MSDMLSIGASGLRAYQSALTTTSENIANSGTAGYVRRSAGVREVTTTAGSTGLNGMGVVVTGVIRAGDVYRAGQVRAASTELARSETSATWLDRIQGALGANKLGDQLTTFFSSARTAAANPAASAPRQAMLEAAAGVAGAFRATGEALGAAAADLEATTRDAVDQLNGLSATLAKVNSALGSANPDTSNAAALLDRRDQVLEQMSALADISVELDPAGRATVRAGSVNGALLVRGVDHATVSIGTNEGGVLAITATLRGEKHAMTPQGGVLAGLADGAQAIADAREALDTLATDFAKGVNDAQAAGDDQAGKPGGAMFAVGDPPSRMTVVLSDPAGIAAAGRGKGARDNSNLLAMEALRGTDGAEQTLTGLITANGAALNARRSVVEAQTAIRDNAVSARDAVTGVNIDEEAVDLMRFQQAYQASSRVIQVAREVLQSILQIG